MSADLAYVDTKHLVCLLFWFNSDLNACKDGCAVPSANSRASTIAELIHVLKVEM